MHKLIKPPMKCNSSNGNVIFFLQIDIVDNIPTVKFAYIHWLGEKVKPMTKARASTHKGAVEEAFGVSFAPCLHVLPALLHACITLYIYCICGKHQSTHISCHIVCAP